MTNELLLTICIITAPFLSVSLFLFYKIVKEEEEECEEFEKELNRLLMYE